MVFFRLLGFEKMSNPGQGWSGLFEPAEKVRLVASSDSLVVRLAPGPKKVT